MLNDFDCKIHNEKMTIKICFDKLGLNSSESTKTNDNLVDIIVKAAKKANAFDVLEDLYFAGLIHGGF